MRVAVITRPNDPLSLRLYESNMIRELSALGVEITRFQEDDPLPSNCDVLWDPGMCMRRIPTILRTSAVPVVGTMHGVKAFSLSLEELTRSSDEHYALEQLKESLKEDWQWFRARAITAVSEYAAKEIIQAFDLPASMVHVVRNGVDHSIFFPMGESAKSNRPYFLHVSRLDPIKNVERILASYARLPEVDRPILVAVVTPEKDQKKLLSRFERMVAIDDVHWVREEVSQHELARLYRGAVALVLTSLRETFGLPIIEAMASGCPVITSNDTGCAETAGNAAVLVDPRSVEEIAAAMRRLMDEHGLSNALKKKGLARASRFTWRKSAEELVQVMPLRL